MKNEEKSVISYENDINRIYFLCPVCGKVYTATIATNTVYDKPINKFQEGVIFTPQYMCKRCHSYAFEIDKEIIRTVRDLRAAGIDTVGCCAGHSMDSLRKDDFGEYRLYGLPEDDGNLYAGSYIAFDPGKVKDRLTESDQKFLADKLSEINKEGDKVPVRIIMQYNDISGYVMIHSLYTLPVFQNLTHDLQKVALGWTREYLDRFCREAIIPVFASRHHRKKTAIKIGSVSK